MKALKAFIYIPILIFTLNTISSVAQAQTQNEPKKEDALVTTSQKMGVQEFFQNELSKAISNSSKIDLEGFEALIAFLIVLNIFITFYSKGDDAFLSEMIRMSFATMFALCLLGGYFYKQTGIGDSFTIKEQVCGTNFDHQGGNDLAGDLFNTVKYMIEKFGCSIYQADVDYRYAESMNNLSTIVMSANSIKAECVDLLQQGKKIGDVLNCQEGGYEGILVKASREMDGCGVTTIGSCISGVFLVIEANLKYSVVYFIVYLLTQILQLIYFLVYFGMQFALSASLLLIRLMAPFLILEKTRNAVISSIKAPLTFAFYGFTQKLIFYFSMLLAEGVAVASLLSLRHFSTGGSLAGQMYVYLFVVLAVVALFLIQIGFVAKIPTLSRAIMNLSLDQINGVVGAVVQAGFSAAAQYTGTATGAFAGTVGGNVMKGVSMASGPSGNLLNRAGGMVQNAASRAKDYISSGGQGAAPSKKGDGRPQRLRPNNSQELTQSKAGETQGGVKEQAMGSAVGGGAEVTGGVGSGGTGGMIPEKKDKKGPTDTMDGEKKGESESEGKDSSSASASNTQSDTMNISANVVYLSGALQSSGGASGAASPLSPGASPGNASEPLASGTPVKNEVVITNEGSSPASASAQSQGMTNPEEKGASDESGAIGENPRKRQIQNVSQREEEQLNQAKSFKEFQERKQALNKEESNPSRGGALNTIKSSFLTSSGRKNLAKSVLSGGLNFATSIVSQAGSGGDINIGGELDKYRKAVQNTMTDSRESYEADQAEYAAMVQKRDDPDYEDRNNAVDNVEQTIEEKLRGRQSNLDSAQQQARLNNEMSDMLKRDPKNEDLSPEKKAELDKKEKELIRQMENGEIYADDKDHYLRDMYDNVLQKRPDLADKVESARNEFKERTQNSAAFNDFLSVVLRNPKPTMEEIENLWGAMQKPLDQSSLEQIEKHKEIIEAALNRARLNKAKV